MPWIFSFGLINQCSAVVNTCNCLELLCVAPSIIVCAFEGLRTSRLPVHAPVNSNVRSLSLEEVRDNLDEFLTLLTLPAICEISIGLNCPRPFPQAQSISLLSRSSPSCQLRRLKLKCVCIDERRTAWLFGSYPFTL